MEEINLLWATDAQMDALGIDKKLVREMREDSYFKRVFRFDKAIEDLKYELFKEFHDGGLWLIGMFKKLCSHD
ncbi:hypothetical protein [Chitinophaga varians]|uniref:hypothetical protein n=1 Tax=Chitinophaga varians TaxID=2202339 RepID=UPI00165FE878|nr:hypothetical protein [Chitinophaga varians]MBC9913175.1 hypothetical protein [Chitinophaga varians]